MIAGEAGPEHVIRFPVEIRVSRHHFATRLIRLGARLHQPWLMRLAVRLIRVETSVDGGLTWERVPYDAVRDSLDGLLH